MNGVLKQICKNSVILEGIQLFNIFLILKCGSHIIPTSYNAIFSQ